MIALFPEEPEHEKILRLIQSSFRFSDKEFGYEIKMREALSEIWLMLFEQARPVLSKSGGPDKNNEKITSFSEKCSHCLLA